MSRAPVPPQRIAVVGSGIAGLGAAWTLHGAGHDVHVYERSAHVGGHTYTVPIEEPRADGTGAHTRWIDMGFIVHNDWTYPNLIQLLETLEVPVEDSSMSFSVRSDADDVEYNGTDLNSLFVQRRNLVRPTFLRMIRDILRFHRDAPRVLDDDQGDLTLADYLAQHRYRGPFVDWYLVPMTAAIWSTAPDDMDAFPIRTLVRFLVNHGMLQVNNRPTWKVISGGSKTYVEALVARLGRARVTTDCAVARVERDEGGRGVTLRFEGDRPAARYDQVVIAAHSDQALAMLAAPSAAEQSVLGAIDYRPNAVVLHTDPRAMPRRRGAWASWNYLLEPEHSAAPRLTYWMNRLQNLDGPVDYFVTLNPPEGSIDPAAIRVTRTMAHPQFTRDAAQAQRRWAEISGRDRVHYAGAYWFFGFHEDGLRSGLRVAEMIGAAARRAAA
ncbi:MAG: FAD-dependent oxidoreductase [Acidobacteriota bacterium]